MLTRTISGFLGDHGDVGNWRCPLGLAALSVETVLILLAAWQVWVRTRRSAPLPLPLPEPLPGPARQRAPGYSHAG